MKFSCTKENLLHALQCVGSSTGKQVNLPILQNLLISINNEGTKIISTNLEIAIKTNVRAKVEQNGDYTVPARLFFEYISTLPGERVDGELKEGGLDVQLGNAKTVFRGMEASEFPLIPDVENTSTFECNAKQLLSAITKVLFAAAKTDVRPELSGVLFSFNHERTPGKLVLAATDSFRLAEAQLPLQGDFSNKSHHSIVPSHTVSEVARIISVNDMSLPVIIKISDSQVTFVIAGTEITSRLIDGQYPHYEHIIPTHTQVQVTCLKDELVRQIKAASLFTEKGVGAAQLSWDAEHTQLVVAAKSGVLGEHISSLDAEGEGNACTIHLNYRYILEGLMVIPSERVVIKIASPDAPVLFLPLGALDSLYMIMPIKQ